MKYEMKIIRSMKNRCVFLLKLLFSFVLHNEKLFLNLKLCFKCIDVRSLDKKDFYS